MVLGFWGFGDAIAPSSSPSPSLVIAIALPPSSPSPSLTPTPTTHVIPTRYNREKVIFDAVAATDAAASDPLNPDGDRDALARRMSYAFSPAVSMAELGSAIQLWNQQPPAAHRRPLVMVLCPSRELCAQVGLVKRVESSRKRRAEQ